MKGNFDYLFFLLADEYWLESPSGQEFRRAFETAFARRLGSAGAVVASFDEDRERNYQVIRDKPWPGPIAESLRRLDMPHLLVISEDVEAFNPEEHSFELLSLPREGSALDRLEKFLREIERVVRGGRNLYLYMQNRRGAQEGAFRRIWRRLGGSVELKPGWAGVAIDLKALFARNEGEDFA